uniref:Uncharacterized protein n=1 Tax=Hucho hucho TaxID=62062 RepID=A0A4W5KAB8_9TELE
MLFFIWCTSLKHRSGENNMMASNCFDLTYTLTISGLCQIPGQSLWTKRCPVNLQMIGLPAGIIGFILTKREVDKNRLKQLRTHQRMNRSNEGEYEGSRYPHAQPQEVISGWIIIGPSLSRPG